jgi:hypothetical protein
MWKVFDGGGSLEKRREDPISLCGVCKCKRPGQSILLDRLRGERISVLLLNNFPSNWH